jgi:hypothetical protein
VVRHHKTGSSIVPELIGPIPDSSAPVSSLFRIPSTLDLDWRPISHQDLATGYFDSHRLKGRPEDPADPDLAAGKYRLRLQFFDTDGRLVEWDDGPDPLIELGVADETPASPLGIEAAPAYHKVLNGGRVSGFQMVVWVDNNRCSGEIGKVSSGSPVGDCGVHTYSDPTTDVDMPFVAGHPNRWADYSFAIVRGNDTEAVASFDDQVSVDGDGTKVVEAGQLLGDCEDAAFAQNLHVKARARNGYGRLSGYDVVLSAGFALVDRK